jgi:hypothetical protein
MSDPNQSEPRRLKPVPKRKHTAKSLAAPEEAGNSSSRNRKRKAAISKTSGASNPRKMRPRAKRLLEPQADPFKILETGMEVPPPPLYTQANAECGNDFEFPTSASPSAQPPRRLPAKITMVIKILGGTIVFLFFALGLHEAGRVGGFRQAEAARPQRLKPDAKAIEAMNKACQHLRAGEGSEAAAILDEVAKRAPDTRSLAYLRALASLQSGNFDQAARHARESIHRAERESDAMVVLSLAEPGQAGTGVLRNAKVVREAKLREAVEADPSNPSPMVELAGVLRAGGRNEEALQLLKAADSRLLPVDPHMVVATSIRLIELQALPDSKLPDPVMDGPLPELFSSLYIVLRQRRHDLAVELEAKCRMRSPAELFDYLAEDPAFRELRRSMPGGPAL